MPVGEGMKEWVEEWVRKAEEGGDGAASSATRKGGGE